MKRNSGFAFIGVVVLLCLGVLILGTVTYMVKLMVDKAKTVEAKRQEQMTNGLAEPFPANFPEAEFWLVEEPASWSPVGGELVLELPEAGLAEVFDSVGDYRIESSWSPEGPWTGEDFLTGSREGVRQTLLGLLRIQAASQPYPSCGFIRYSRP